MGQNKLWCVRFSVVLCVLALWPVVGWAAPKPRPKPVPSPGKHPYFSKHPRVWKQLVPLLWATRQLTPITPRHFSFATPARDQKKRRYALSQHKGELILLTRWATWCKSCKYDLAAKRKLAKQVKGVPVTIVGVTHEPFSLVAKYHRTAPAAKIFPYSLVDPRGRLARYLPGAAYPATSLIDPWGWIIASRVGPGLWVTPAYKKLFKRLASLAQLAWRTRSQQPLVSRPPAR